ncbi:hypothetical protein V3H18_07030 [Methylocystis sp. 9N]|uniref:Uncharacterized protein n=1 Tax=Methylocystis borbori TaxID=3118750 RepID=A0ABU7XGG6_9HYPH
MTRSLIGMAIQTLRLSAKKTLWARLLFQPSLDKNRVMTLAHFHVIDRAEAVRFMGAARNGISHVSVAPSFKALKAFRPRGRDCR